MNQSGDICTYLSMNITCIVGKLLQTEAHFKVN